MKWEPVENAEKVLEDGEFVLGWVEVSSGFQNYETYTDCEYSNGEFSILNPDKNECYTVTHFMVIEEPNDENTNQAS